MRAGKALVRHYEAYVEDLRLIATWGEGYKDIRLGKSRFTVQEFTRRSLNLQQTTMDKAVIEGMHEFAHGRLKLQKDSLMLTLGNYADKRIRTVLREFYKAEGLTESRIAKHVGVNRKIKNDLLAGIPDLRLGDILFSDSTLASKNASTLQLRKWIAIKPNAINLIIRPSVKFVPNYKPGSYVINSKAIKPLTDLQINSRGKI